MFRPKTPDQNSRAARQKLSPWTHTPTQDDLASMLAEADGKRGALFEVTIRRDLPPVFVLTCQWEAGVEEPVWALYEGEDGATACWSYPNSSLDMIYEIICMSLPGGVKSSTPSKMVGSAAAAPPQEKPAPPPATPAPAQAQPTAAPQPHVAANPPAPPHAAPYAVPPGYPQPMPPGYPQPYPPGYPQGYPPPGYAPMNAPYPPGYGQPMPPANWPQPAQPPGYGQVPPGYPGGPAPYPYPPAPAAAPGSAEPSGHVNRLVDLLDKGKNHILLGHLFIEAGIIPEPCVDAALKLQELVRKGLLSNGAAIEALRKSAESGGALSEETIEACRREFPGAQTLNESVSVMKPAVPLDPREVARQVLQLIMQAGVVTQNDVTTAEGVRKKHGGDVGNILVSAGKLEKSTLDAARHCHVLLREGKVDNEQAFRVLRHCQKNKCSVDEALRALANR